MHSVYIAAWIGCCLINKSFKAFLKIDWEHCNCNWKRMTEGHYMLRSIIKDWEAKELWRAYIQLTDAEEAFKINKQDLHIRPIWHQKDDRIKAHVFVCFISFVTSCVVMTF